MAWMRAAIIAALFTWGSGSAGQDITLTSPDGQVELSGTLLGFDGEFYRIDTIYGELTLDGSGVSCDGPGCPNLQDFVAEVAFSGSASMGAVLMPSLVEGFVALSGYSTERKDVDASTFDYLLRSEGKTVARFSFFVATTDEGFGDLLNNDADIVMALREIRTDERQRARDAGMGDLTKSNRSRVLALDAMVPVVAPSNPVNTISPLALAEVLAGKITNWKDLGGADAPISVHLPVARSGLGQFIEDKIMAPANMAFAETVIRHARGAYAIDAVLHDPFAISIASYAESGSTRPLTLTGPCGFSLAASRGTIKTEDYPLTAPMFLYLPARRLPKIAREFLAYTRSPNAQLVIRRAGFVDQAPEEVSIDDQGYRFANAMASAGPEVSLQELQRMTRRLYGMARLTTSFRFEAGSVRLDAQSRSNVEQLARAIEQGKYDAREILLVGFSDGNGPAATNRDIALRRAESVRRAVMDAAETADFDRLQMDVDAFGEALPMACDNSAWGRQANRRVEVWVR